ncbi:hypothetical protein BDW59DRAFT_146752 [Aspergillus cavernicola]|uniref:Secreted protein n=1 Tax=Aspergillus cavernicola TaxID=176166 RepID=A0ABR4IBG3_9EURO
MLAGSSRALRRYSRLSLSTGSVRRWWLWFLVSPRAVTKMILQRTRPESLGTVSPKGFENCSRPYGLGWITSCLLTWSRLSFSLWPGCP